MSEQENASGRKLPCISLLAESDYDSGYLNDYGGGNVGWWQDYIRAEVGRCNDYWRSQIEQLADLCPANSATAEKRRQPMSELYYVPGRPEKDGTVRLDWPEAERHHYSLDELNPGWHWLLIEATTEDGAAMLRQIKEATNG
jgi:hypothetical protein